MKSPIGKCLHSPGLDASNDVVRPWFLKIANICAIVARRRTASNSLQKCCFVLSSRILARSDGANPAVYVSLHDQLQDCHCDATKQITLSMLLQKLGLVHVGLAYRVLGLAYV